MRKILIVFTILTLLLSGCGSREDGAASTRYLTTMDTVMTLTAYGPNREDGLDKAQAEILALNAALSTGLTDSEISRLNESGSAALSPEPLALLERALELYDSTDGLFDPSVYPLVKLWGFYDKNYHVPTAAELSETLSRVGADHIRISGNTVTLEDGRQIDLGGIGKGYASQRACEILREAGVSSALLSLGGNVQCLGSKPDGSDWNIGIRDPWQEGALYAAVKVSDQAVITSGGYERYFEDPDTGIVYRHILDPRTGRPAESGLSSVSIVTADGTLGDGLSTALYIMGLEEATAFWRTYSDEFEMILITDDGTLYATEGLQNRISSSGKIHFLSR